MSSTKPKPVHKTPLITLETFRAGFMKPEGYAAEDISKAIIDLCSKGRDYTEPQKLALEKFKYRGSWNLLEPANADDLRTWLDIFNNMFFNGVLTGYCTLGFFEPKRGGWYRTVKAYCETQSPGDGHDPRYKIERPRSHLAIRRRLPDNNGPEFRIKCYQIFAIYVCRCDGCDEKNREFSIMGGHHKAWIAAAHAIEQADKPLVPAAHGHSDGEFLSECIEQDAILGRSLNFEINKETGLAAAVQNGAKLPPDPELRMLGVNILRVWRIMQRYRETKSRGFRKEQREKQLMKANLCLRGHWTLDGGARIIKISEEDLDEDKD
ncbi:hypothetical protein V8E51_005569 [Hyaloscypha variabilis]